MKPEAACWETSQSGTPEEDLMALYQEEIKSGTLFYASQSSIAGRLAGLFEALPDEAVLRIRHALDSNLGFRRDGSAVDLRSLVFEAITQHDRDRVLERIRAAATGECQAPAHQGLVVLSDVDDTLLPGSDALQISGCDRSWSLDGRLYPGVTHLHRELRGKDDNEYTVLLTARPPGLCSSLPAKVARIAGQKVPRMAILPGASGTRDSARNVLKILTQNVYDGLGEVKLLRLTEYASLFPECAGRFVFIGDDGQADLRVASQMLSQVAPGSQTPLLAFVAIHAVSGSGGFLASSEEREKQTQTIRSEHAPVCPTASEPRHRFFYFTDYEDLAEQLAVSGWLSAAQYGAVLHAAERDRAADSMYEALGKHNVFQLLAGLQERYLSFDYLDDTERAEVEHMAAALPNMAAAHVQLQPPAGLDITSRGAVQLCAIEVEVPGSPSIVRPYISASACDPDANGYRWKGKGEGSILLPMDTLNGEGRRILIKVYASKPGWLQTKRTSLGRCYIVLEPRSNSGRVMPAASPICAPSEQIAVSLLAPNDQGIAPREAGQLILTSNWVNVPGVVPEKRGSESFARKTANSLAFHDDLYVDPLSPLAPWGEESSVALRDSY